jgi:GT2 family glycosyltransferase
VRFTILAAPGSDPGETRARASALIAVDGPDAVAAAARSSADPFVLLLAAGARPRSGAFSGVASTLGERTGVLGGTSHAAGTRLFGWMLAPAPGAPIPFEPAAVAAAPGEGTETAVRGPIDVVAPGMILVARQLLLEPLPRDPLAALVELCARARDAGLEVVCRPSFACDAPPLDADDRGRAAALRALAEARPELRGTHRLAPGLRRTTIERDVRLEGGRRVRARFATPKLTVLVHGDGAQLAARRARDLAPYVVAARAVDDPVSALRAEMRVRGDRYVLIAEASALPAAAGLDALVEALESAPFVALAAPNPIAARCALLALARIPQHVEPSGATLDDAMQRLVEELLTLRRAVRVTGAAQAAGAFGHRASASAARATIVFLAASLPELMRITLDSLVPASRTDDEIVAVCAANAHTTQRILAAYPQLRIEHDEADPLLTDGANRAFAASSRELVVLVADDVLLPAGTLDRMRDAFARFPALGAAFPAVPGAPGGEGVVDVNYADLAQLRIVAKRRLAENARRLEPIDLAVSPVVAVAREALEAVGGIDPAHGPTRRGIADLVLRLRAAGYAVIRCDDALAHRFDASASHNPAAAAGLQQTLAPVDPNAIARGFDPAKRVPFTRTGIAAPRASASHTIAIPIAGAAELERAAIVLTAAARAFDASSPVRVHLLLDGELSPADAVARIRPILAGGARPIDDSVAVRVERVTDLIAWRAALEPGVRVVVAAGHERDALSGLPSITAAAMRELLEPAVR